MALALKKDVQKASYYVFFLGAQEARELRGERVLLSTLPHIISRSRQQEPLKVTLQISQKGIKIIQVSVEFQQFINAAEYVEYSHKRNISFFSSQFLSLSIFNILLSVSRAAFIGNIWIYVNGRASIIQTRVKDIFI